MDIRLNKFSGKNNVNVDTFVKLNVKQNKNFLPYDEIKKVINLNDQFQYERNLSNNYKLLFNVNLLVSNVLFDLTDSKNYNNYTLFGFNNYIKDYPDKFTFLDNSYPYDNDVNDNGDLTFADSITKNLIEKNGVFGFFEPNKTKKKPGGYITLAQNASDPRAQKKVFWSEKS